MSTEENVPSGNTTDEQFRFVKQGRYGDLRTNDRSGLGTVVALIVGTVVCVVFYKLAQQLSASHEVQDVAVPAVIVAVVPYIGATFITLTCLAAVAFLFIVTMCVRPLVESNLSGNGVKLLVCTFMIVLGLSAATVMYLWWFYTT